ncbi:hypothetical protein BHF68_03115 [Desulfuribacillus alkaliarsenatis]|uniref:Phosphodiester glycosidase domain-containing protein n=2 Tax=Desulfuribacillus alkaliarsenatis TaxID=766136 RepID=A0A1E5G6K0_9FIRM|nr:hypothetical protein BHF68_03115 [Desulfuribacillus alkaliarsenatis]
MGFKSINVSADELTQLYIQEYEISENISAFTKDINQLSLDISKSYTYASMSNMLIEAIRNNAFTDMLAYEQQRFQLDALVEASLNNSRRSEDVLDQILARMLGQPIGQTFGENAGIKVYSLEEAGYRGFMAKVRLHNPNAVRMVLAEDQVFSSGETTRNAANRSGAMLAVNAGGFMSEDGKIRPLGITVIDGEVLTYSNSDLSVIGFNENGNLVGGRIESEEQLNQIGIIHGASFLPTLLKDGIKQSIPAQWANARQPRTMIGHFENGDLLFIVIDGRREGWSMGVTLEEAQDKLLEFNVRDAYNLDGGGSSTFFYDGQVLNRPSSGSERRVTTNIVIIP